jgi:hypothetical protein
VGRHRLNKPGCEYKQNTPFMDTGDSASVLEKNCARAYFNFPLSLAKTYLFLERSDKIVL